MTELQTPLRACQSGDLFALFDADGNYLASIETAVTAAEIVRRCNEYEALQSQLLAQETAVADAWNAEREELQKRLGEVEQSRDTTYEIERQYTDRWMAAWEKFRKAKDNAEATTVFREFLNEPFSAKRISEAALRAEAAEAKLAAFAKGWNDDRIDAEEKFSELQAKLAAVRALAAKAINDAYNPSTSRSLYAINEIVKEPSNA